MKHLLLLLALWLPVSSFGVGTVTFTSEDLKSFCPNLGLCNTGRKITVTATADVAAATFPTKVIEMRGFIVKVVTNPGATAPTDNYDMILGAPEDATVDVLNSLLLNRDTTTTEEVYTVGSGATVPVYVNGRYTLTLTNNAVNSAATVITFYILNP